MNSILASNILAHAKFAAERLLVAGVLAMQEPGGGAKAQDRVPLAPHPRVVVGEGAGAHGRLEEHVLPVGCCNRDHRRLRQREREQPRVQQVAELPGVFGCEGLERERVAAGLYLFCLLILAYR